MTWDAVGAGVHVVIGYYFSLLLLGGGLAKLLYPIPSTPLKEWGMRAVACTELVVALLVTQLWLPRLWVAALLVACLIAFMAARVYSLVLRRPCGCLGKTSAKVVSAEAVATSAIWLVLGLAFSATAGLAATAFLSQIGLIQWVSALGVFGLLLVVGRALVLRRMQSLPGVENATIQDSTHRSRDQGAQEQYGPVMR